MWQIISFSHWKQNHRFKWLVKRPTTSVLIYHGDLYAQIIFRPFKVCVCVRYNHNNKFLMNKHQQMWQIFTITCSESGGECAFLLNVDSTQKTPRNYSKSIDITSIHLHVNIYFSHAACVQAADFLLCQLFDSIYKQHRANFGGNLRSIIIKTFLVQIPQWIERKIMRANQE